MKNSSSSCITGITGRHPHVARKTGRIVCIHSVKCQLMTLAKVMLTVALPKIVMIFKWRARSTSKRVKHQSNVLSLDSDPQGWTRDISTRAPGRSASWSLLLPLLLFVSLCQSVVLQRRQPPAVVVCVLWIGSRGEEHFSEYAVALWLRLFDSFFVWNLVWSD